MEVYEFEKSLLDRLEESMNVLSWKEEVIPASQVRSEWTYYIELQIEPAGWQALWKIPRVICEELQIRYPTVVFGMVDQVMFKELKAVFEVIAVQDDDVHLPERHEVALEDLWPTVSQENTELDIEGTAECIDRLRFFYTNVWMPWDNDSDDDLNWVEKNLESRLRFCYDLRKGKIKRSVAAHIRTLLAEARYIQQRREYLELDIGDNDEVDDKEKFGKSHITDLMRLHLRLAIIRREIELLENPEMRHIYEQIKFDEDKSLKDAGHKYKEDQKISYFVALPYTLDKQMAYLKIAKGLIPKTHLVEMKSSLQDVLNICKASDNIFLTPGRHNIKFLEYLNNSGSITGLIPSNQNKVEISNETEQEIVLASNDDESILLVFDGDFTLENLTLDGKNIKTGILVKKGKVTLRNCKIIGNAESSTQQAIVCYSGAQLVLEGCKINNFATGVAIQENASAVFSNVTITSCYVGLDINGKPSKVKFEDIRVIGSKKCGLYIDGFPLDKTDNKSVCLDKSSDLLTYTSSLAPWTGTCQFANCKWNIYILNKNTAFIDDQSLLTIFDDNDNLYLNTSTMSSS